MPTRSADSASVAVRRRQSGVRRIGSEQDPPGTAAGLCVRFVERPEGGLQAIELITPPRSGVFLPLCHTLFRHGVQIVGSRVVTKPHGIEASFQVATEQGGPIQGEQSLVLQQVVLSALFDAMGAR